MDGCSCTMDACHDNGLIEQIMNGDNDNCIKNYIIVIRIIILYPYSDSPAINLRYVSQLQTEITANTRQMKKRKRICLSTASFTPPPTPPLPHLGRHQNGDSLSLDSGAKGPITRKTPTPTMIPGLTTLLSKPTTPGCPTTPSTPPCARSRTLRSAVKVRVSRARRKRRRRWGGVAGG